MHFVNDTIVASDYQKHILNDYGITCEVMPSSVGISGLTPRVIEKVQPKILVSGSLERYHNVIAVVQAHKLVKQKYPRSELIIAGDGSMKNDLVEIIKEKQIYGITFLNRDKYEDAFADADVYVNSLRFEYLGPSLLKALGSGLPVISSPITGYDKIVNRENILFFRYNDHQVLADRIIELVENNELVRQLSIKGVQLASEYDISKIRLKWNSLYSKILA